MSMAGVWCTAVIKELNWGDGVDAPREFVEDVKDFNCESSEGEAKPDAAWVLTPRGQDGFARLEIVAQTEGKPAVNGILGEARAGAQQSRRAPDPARGGHSPRHTA